MWWIVLILIMAAMAALLWWRHLQEQRWQREMTYLTRHEQHGAARVHSAQNESPDLAQMHSMADHQADVHSHIQSAGNEHNALFVEEVQQQSIPSDAAQGMPVNMSDQAHVATSSLLNAENTLQPQITVIESSPLPSQAAWSADYSEPVEISATSQISPLQQHHSAPMAEYQLATPSIDPFEDISIAREDADSSLLDSTSFEISAGASDLANTDLSTSEESVTEKMAVDESLPVITLEEARRNMANHDAADDDDYFADASNMDGIELNWQQKQQIHRQNHPRHTINEIKPDDPLLARVRSHTKAEQEALLQERALKNFDPVELELATQHSLRQVPAHLAHTSTGRNLFSDQRQNKQIIDEEDIRINLLRQRLARLRQQNNNRNPDHAFSVPVIEEEEVILNLAKTDSPINKQKFKRPTVRESVIPAAARIGEQQAVQMMVPIAELSADKSSSEAFVDRHVPLSTRFTPFQPMPEAHKPTVEAVGAGLERHPVQEALDNSSSANVIYSPESDLNKGDEAIWSTGTTHQVDYASDSEEYDESYPYSDYNNIADAGQHLRDSASPEEVFKLHGSDDADQDVSTQQWVISDSGHHGYSEYSSSTITKPSPSVHPTSPFHYIEDADTEPMSTAAPNWHFADDDVENELVSAEIAYSAGTIAQQLSQDQAASTNAHLSASPMHAQSNKMTAENVISAPSGSAPVQLSMQPNRLRPTAPTVNFTSAPVAMQQIPILPSMDLLLPAHYDSAAQQSEETLLENGITIEEKLAEFKVKVKVIDAFAGPVITRYEIEPAQGVRGSQVVNLEKDLARSLGFASIRIVETIPGKTCMGIELPNPKRQIIRLSEIFSAPVFQQSQSKLTLALGHGITGQPIVTDLAKAPHLLVAGTTGSGKSVGVNAMILSMLYKATPDDVRLIMIDPKMLELSIYEGIPHLLAPVVTDMKLAANALTWCVNEMEKRYRLMSYVGVRNLAGFNQKIAEKAQQGEKLVNPFSLNPSDPELLEKLPYIVVVVDEFADLMMTAGKKIEELIARLAQKARAAGIHLILATQRPSVDVITGLIKANIPTRIAFQVSSKVDSRTILDQMGAENLLGQGDMLFLPPGTAYPERVHGAFVADEEVHRVVNYLKQFGEPHYIDDILTAGVSEDDLFSNASSGRNLEDDQDPLYDDAVALVVKTRKASISSVQRHLRIGYNRAARLVEQMEADGVVSAPEGNGNRTVLAPQNNHLDG